jgi:DNA polymerase elongation subunit (family B)
MSEVIENKVQKDIEIEKFLQGSNDKLKYVVNIEGNYFNNCVSLIYQTPNNENIVQDNVEYTPFIYIKDLKKLGISVFNNDKNGRLKYINRHNIKIKKLETYNNNRLEYGYCYIVEGSSIYDIKNYFNYGELKITDTNVFKNYLINHHGFDFNNEEHSKLYYSYISAGTVKLNDSLLRLTYILKPEEIFLIQNNSRIYKGFENYNELHRLQFDIETTGLDSNRHRIFMIGIKDNMGFESVLEVKKKDDNESEKELIFDFFETIYEIKPSILTHYNGENFDWEFILNRAKILGLDLEERYPKIIDSVDLSRNVVVTTRNINKVIERLENQTVKYGSEVERYTKTKIWGYSNIDIIHAAKRTQKINSDIQNTKLKYICQFENIAKENRMYVEGDKIFKIWDENKWYLINRKNNKYKLIDESFQDKSNEYLIKFKLSLQRGKDFNDDNFTVDDLNYIEIISGKDIIKQYLLDDLWETEQVDLKYNESSFLLAKIIPTTYERITTMGSAAVWKLIMTAWSYNNNLAIPISDPDNDKFSGGLARAYYIGFTENIRKLDFAGLYPSLQITYDIFPNVDVTNALKRLLTYLLDTRNVFKKLSNDETLTASERSFYKTKQLPLKILNNSLFGALGSGDAFPWGENVVSGQITCAGRLHLRKMIKYFTEYNFKPILAVTDGVNFAIPEYVNRDIDGNLLNEPQPLDSLKYVYDGVEYIGVSAIIEKYNYDILKYSYDDNRIIKIDDDGSFKSSLTLSRINYANLTYDSIDNKTGKIKPGKIKLTGNTIKSNTMPEYIVDFISKSLKMVLDNKPAEFVEYYYEYLEKIYYMRIPLKKIASKSKIKLLPNEYLNRSKDKNGKNKAKQAHMELVIKENLNVELGDTIYYVNIGKSKSHGDSKILIDKETGEEYMCSKLIDTKSLENNPELLGEYNIKKYIAAFNEKVKSLLIGFPEEVQNTILKDVVRNKKTKNFDLAQREYYTESQLVLKNFVKDGIEESMYLEELELDLWNKTGRDPKLIFDEFLLHNDYDLYGVAEYKLILDKLNKKRIETNKPIVKSIDDVRFDGDLVLNKFKNNYTIHEVRNGYLYEIYKLK